LITHSQFGKPEHEKRSAPLLLAPSAAPPSLGEVEEPVASLFTASAMSFLMAMLPLQEEIDHSYGSMRRETRYMM
jgi:hypothetical protein